MKQIEVLDKGHVQYMDHMGTDLSIVNTARVSFDKESAWDTTELSATECTPEHPVISDDAWMLDGLGQSFGYTRFRRLSPRDTKLIHYLAKHNHWTPFGQVNIQLRIKMPIFVARQMMRSNVGIVWNEVSRRYVDSEPEFYEPEVWRGRPEGSIKQGSGQEIPRPLRTMNGNRLTTDTAIMVYKDMLEDGVCPEQARIVLPQSTYTEVVGNFTLAALARVCALREGKTAQWEIQQFSKAMGEIASKYFPVSWEALTGGGE